MYTYFPESAEFFVHFYHSLDYLFHPFVTIFLKVTYWDGKIGKQFIQTDLFYTRAFIPLRIIAVVLNIWLVPIYQCQCNASVPVETFSIDDFVFERQSNDLRTRATRNRKLINSNEVSYTILSYQFLSAARIELHLVEPRLSPSDVDLFTF